MKTDRERSSSINISGNYSDSFGRATEEFEDKFVVND